jgi:hypothetical protein
VPLKLVNLGNKALILQQFATHLGTVGHQWFPVLPLDPPRAPLKLSDLAIEE